MSIRTFPLVAAAFSLFCCVTFAQKVTIQQPTDVLADGSAYLWVEGEDVYDLGGLNPAESENGFILVNKTNPIKTIDVDAATGDSIPKGGLDVLPANTNASGGAGIFQQLTGSGTASWKVQFATPSTYYLYLHWSAYNRTTDTGYLNEDSFYLPPAFNKNSTDDWIGFEGVDFLTGELKTGDSVRDGYIDGFPAIASNYVSKGIVESHNTTDEDFYDGQFHWYWMNKANDMDENNAFVSFNGHAIQYPVSQGDVGTVLDYQISTREPYGAIDGLLFSTSKALLEDYTQEQVDQFFLNRIAPIQGDFDGSGALNLPDVNMLNAEIAAKTNRASFDLNADNAVNVGDLGIWVKSLRKTWFGDANLDSEFNSGDLVAVFTAGRYEQGTAATWDQGDWNGDLRFESGDLVAAFSDGGYEKGPVAASAVPEPTACVLLCTMGIALLTRIRRR